MEGGSKRKKEKVSSVYLLMFIPQMLNATYELSLHMCMAPFISHKGL